MDGVGMDDCGMAGRGVRRIGILGGTFDPPHLGHLLIAETVRVALDLESVWFLPAGEPWLKAGQRITAGGQRRQMVLRAIADNPHFALCDAELRRAGPSYTVDTLRELRGRLGDDCVLYFIVGSDVLPDFQRWKEPERILELCRLAVVERPGGPVDPLALLAERYPGAVAAGAVVSVPGPQAKISALELRGRLAAGLSARYQIPDAVADYIRSYGLYNPHNLPEEVMSQSDDTVLTGSTRPVVERLLELALERGAIRYGDFTLSSGRKSAYYFDGRRLSLDPEGAHLLGEALLPLLGPAGVAAIGGPTLGADPIVAAVAAASWRRGAPIPGFIVRKEAKGHGMAQLIEGPLPEGASVAIIDDTCTTGGSLLHAIAAAEAAGCRVALTLAVLDRNEGGSRTLRERGYPFMALLAAGDDGQIRPAANP